MAETMIVRGVAVKRRSPWGVWALNLVTFGAYGAEHWRRVNAEMRDYSAAVGRPFGNEPMRAALAVFPGSLIVVPSLLTVAHTTRRVRRLQRMTAPLGAVVDEVLTGPSVILSLALNLHLVYLQAALNDCWDRAAASERTDAPARAREMALT